MEQGRLKSKYVLVLLYRSRFSQVIWLWRHISKQEWHKFYRCEPGHENYVICVDVVHVDWDNWPRPFSSFFERDVER